MHILTWVILITLPYAMSTYRVGFTGPMSLQNIKDFRTVDFIMYVFWISLFYANSFVLIPRLVNRQKYKYYVLSLIGLFLVAVLVHYVIQKLLKINIPFSGLLVAWARVPAFLLSIAASFVYTRVEGHFEYRHKRQEADKETLKTELAFLRSQISPHFIFNVLNNIVSLVRLKSDELEPTVMKLSGLMQYLLYRTDEEKVAIRVEEQYLNDYIDLQTQRFGNKVQIQTTFKVFDENLQIEPMLLIPFVENAFKHGVGEMDDARIITTLKTDKHNLRFKVSNKFNAQCKNDKDPSSGIGIANVRRRLELLYGTQQELTIGTNGDYFEVDLWLKLDI